MGAAPVIVIEPYGIEVPPGLTTLGRFRSWARSAGFPDQARIDWIAGRIEIDASPEDLFTHGTPKSAIAGRLVSLFQDRRQGIVLVGRARLTNLRADLSAEPDVVVLLDATVRSGGARLGRRSMEIDGIADLIVECVSDSSVTRDNERLREAYHRAGVPEYWLIDARTDPLSFEVLLWRAKG